jgi:mono/diheme cytochrome c family protein
MRRFLPVAAVLSFAFASAGQAQDSSTAKPASTGKSVWQGVFTESQAARGDTEHQTNCTACHGSEKYAGEPFTKNWMGRTAYDLFDQLKTTMPDDNPGSLSAQQYVDIIAYIFKVNGLPAGSDSLTTDLEALRLIKIEPKPDKQTALRPMYHAHAPLTPTTTR